MEMAMTIAAFAVLGLGVVIFILLICKVYLHAPRLSASVKQAVVSAQDSGTFDCRIDLDMHARGGTVYLKDFELFHTFAIFDLDKDVGKYTLNRLMHRPDPGEADDDNGNISAPIEHSFDATGFKILSTEEKRVSLVERISIVQPSEGYCDWPMEGWTLVIRTSTGKVKLPLAFLVHESTKVQSFCRDYSASSKMIWSC
jgi:hypothetical protein